MIRGSLQEDAYVSLIRFYCRVKCSNIVNRIDI